MQRYFIYLSYDGKNYHGWQIQPNGMSVQEKLQNALSTILRSNISVVGAGRTDAGVNASQMVAHFDTDIQFQPAQLAHALNRLLPADIAIQSIRPVTQEAHARFSATARTYHYYITLEKNPFQRHYAYRFPQPLDFDRMNEAAKLLFNYTDFTSFSKLHTDAKTNNCRIMQAQWEEKEPGLWCFTIKADRFLRNMVRAIVGTLTDVGRGRISMDDFCRIIELKDRCKAGTSVPGEALFLCQVDYPDAIFEEVK